MNIIRQLAIAILAVFLVGCAHIPDVKVGYYLAQSKVKIKVIRSVSCDAANNPIVASSTTPTVTHSADPNQFVLVNLPDLKGAFSDTDVKFDFYDDGRLRNINATNIGQGESILKSVFSIATAAFGFDGSSPSYPKECAWIKEVGGGKALTLTYEGEVDVSKGVEVQQSIPPDVMSSFYASQLKAAIGDVFASTEGTESPVAPVINATETGNVLLKARQPGLVQVKVFVVIKDGFQPGDLWKGKLQAAQFGTTYVLPIPSAPIFGKQVFSAAFSESGALSSVQYARNTGAGQALNTISSAQTAFKGETVAQKAAELKAESDYIVQQQRLVQCMADHTNCK